MPPSITHDAGFEIALSHDNEQLTIYDSIGISKESHVVHVGRFSGISNKAFIRRKSSDDFILMELVILREFDFLSGDAVRFALDIVTADGDKTSRLLDPILKKTHDTKRKNPTGILWFAVEMTNVPEGNMSVFVTRGTIDQQTSVFSPLEGEKNVPYTVEIDWRQVDDDSTKGRTRGMRNTPQPSQGSNKRAAKATKSKTTKSTKQPGGSSNANESLESANAKGIVKHAPAKDHDNSIEPNVKPTTDGQEEAEGAADGSQEQSHPIRLKDKNKEARRTPVQGTPGSNGTEVFTTPPTTFDNPDRTPGSGSGARETSGHSIGSTPTLGPETPNAETPTRKRNAEEAFGSDRETDTRRLAYELDLAEAEFDVDDARLQEITDESSPEYLELSLRKARSHHHVAEARLSLKAAQLDGKKDGDWRELKTRTAEAYLAMLVVEEKTFAGTGGASPAFKLRKAYAELEVAEAKAEQIFDQDVNDEVDNLRMALERAEAQSNVAAKEFEVKAAECDDNKDAAYLRLQKHKAEARLKAVQARGRLLLKTGELQR